MKHIFKDRGVISAVSTEIGVPYTTVHSWKTRGRVPEDWRDQVVLALARRGIAVTHGDLRGKVKGQAIIDPRPPKPEGV